MTNKRRKEKFNQIITRQSSQWIIQYEEEKKNRDWSKNSAIVALNVLIILKERKWSQKKLAEKMGVSAQQVSKIVRGKENFKFETISKLENALDIKLMNIDLIDREREQRNQSVMLEWLRNNVSLNAPIHKPIFDSHTDLVTYSHSVKKISKQNSFTKMEVVSRNILKPTG